jgi:hypothetical protein
MTSCPSSDATSLCRGPRDPRVLAPSSSELASSSFAPCPCLERPRARLPDPEAPAETFEGDWAFENGLPIPRVGQGRRNPPQSAGSVSCPYAYASGCRGTPLTRAFAAAGLSAVVERQR